MELTRDPREVEKENLQAALDMFLDLDADKLQSFFLEHTLMDEEKQMLTLSVPIEALDALIWEKLLRLEGCQSMLQWTAQLDQWEWILPEWTPNKIREIIPAIYGHLTRQAQKQEEAQKNKTREKVIDTELGELGLPPSRRNIKKLQATFQAIRERNQFLFIEKQAQRAKNSFPDDKDTTKNAENIKNREQAHKQAQKDAPKHSVNFKRLKLKMDELNLSEKWYRFFHGPSSITITRIWATTQKDEWTLTYNWEKQEFINTWQWDELFLEYLKNSLLRFLILIDEEMIEEIQIGKMKKSEWEKLENWLKERLKQWNASFFIRFHGQGIIIPDISEENYQDQMVEIQEKYKPEKISIVYRTFSYALYDGEFRAWQDRTYDQCIEKHLDLMQARCRATLAQKASFRESKTSGNATYQERDAFTNGVADHCRKFFFKKDPFNPEDMQEFLDLIHAEGTLAEKSDILLGGVIKALFGDTETSGIDSSICRAFFFEKDPNNLDDIADFLAFLQEKGTNQDERPWERHVGIVYNSPVIWPTSDIPRILAKETTKKKKK